MSADELVTVLAANEADEAFLARCLSGFRAAGTLQHYTEKLWQRHDPDNGRFVVIGYIGSDPIGFVYFDTRYVMPPDPNDPDAELESDETETGVTICVVDEHRGRELGAKLLSAALTGVFDLGAKFETLKTYTDYDNCGSRRALEGAGFEESDRQGGTVHYRYPL